MFFITQQQLALYIYQPTSKYYQHMMAEVAQIELLAYMDSVKAKHNPIELLSHFLNQRLDRDIWCFHFRDDSKLFVKRENNEEKQCTEYHFVVLLGIWNPFEQQELWDTKTTRSIR
ncbi:DUF1132 family protein [Conchiformibius steedae]|uniref:DUF1132 family protein n=1 Tax=Conchiformibius steedae TaxID=153493 RepID=UPI0026EDEF91|nr:DUF1132 family protein [Conchiformibius steedae]